MVDQDVIPDLNRLIDVTLAPGGQRSHVPLLARCRSRRQALGLPQRRIDLAVDSVRAEQHEQAADHAMGEAEARVDLDHLLQRRHRRFAVFEVFADGAVEEQRRLGAFGRQHEPPRVTVHDQASHLGDARPPLGAL
jgi:hypothetical protein